MFVVDGLQFKQSDSKIPPLSVLPCCDDLPYLEDPEIHVQTVACCLRGGAGPCRYDSAHWKDVLLHFGSASREIVAFHGTALGLFWPVD